jgi:aminopeptidase-like protein
MISRHFSDDEPNKVTMFYSDSCLEFKSLTENNLKEYNIELEPDYQASANPPLGSDHRSFVAKGIPIMRFKPGHREEYHTPADELSTIDWDVMEKIIKISFLNVWELSTTDW